MPGEELSIFVPIEAFVLSKLESPLEIWRWEIRFLAPISGSVAAQFQGPPETTPDCQRKYPVPIWGLRSHEGPLSRPSKSHSWGTLVDPSEPAFRNPILDWVPKLELVFWPHQGPISFPADPKRRTEKRNPILVPKLEPLYWFY